MSSGKHWLIHPRRESRNAKTGIFTADEYRDVTEYFGRYPGYRQTPLHSLVGLASALGISDLLVKDESQRLGLNAFKILGVAYAVHRLVVEGRVHQRTVLACATDGNHGRALAHIGRQLGLKTKVFIHKGASAARIESIENELAEVVVVDGNYDDSVREVAREAEMHGWTVISDTAWPGYETVPRYIMAGYTMLLAEAEQQWATVPDAVVVQAGVGGLATAVVSWFLDHYPQKCPVIVCCEPSNAACVLESIRNGKRVLFPGSLHTVMEGLSCGTVSSVAWPMLETGLDACVAISDDEASAAVQELSNARAGDVPIAAGHSGAAGVAALTAIMRRDDLQTVRHELRFDRQSRVLVINTEGVSEFRSTIPYSVTSRL